HFPLLRAARQLWPEWSARLGDIGFRRSGAVWVDLPGEAPLIDLHARDLAALHAAALAAGVRTVAQSVRGFSPGVVALSDGETVPTDLLILATGAEASDLAPELAVLSPIKGQILRYAGVSADDDRPVLRCRGGYAVPARDGLRIGATMEPGLADRRVDPALAAPLGRLGVDLFPALEHATYA